MFASLFSTIALRMAFELLARPTNEQVRTRSNMRTGVPSAKSLARSARSLDHELIGLALLLALIVGGSLL